MNKVNNGLIQILETVIGARKASTKGARNLAVKDYLENAIPIICGKTYFTKRFLQLKKKITGFEVS